MELNEYQECCLLAEYLETLQRQGRILLYTHIPHETWTNSWSQKLKNKKQGVKKGFPDYVIIFPKKILFIEMKRKKGGQVSREQKQWLQTLSDIGLAAVVCRGFEEAQFYIQDNL